MLLLTTVGGPYGYSDDPQNPGVFTENYDASDYTYDVTTRNVIQSDYTITYVGGYAGAPPTPTGYAKPTTELVDRYVVPDAGLPGHDAAAVGQDRRVYHDGTGGLTFVDAAVCDLAIVGIQPVAPAGAGGASSAVVSWTTSSAEPVIASAVGAAFTRNVPDLAATGGVIAGLPPGNYQLALAHADPVGCLAQRAFVVPSASVSGCADEYAANYAPTATQPDPARCAYAPRWRAAWQEMAVRVAPPAGDTAGYLEAELFVGFRAGHPLAALRPLGAPVQVRATVAPDGHATFRLGPYLRPQLGTSDGSGGYRLDINSDSVDDFYVGYELRRPTGELLEHGYALNAAVPDEELTPTAMLSPWAVRPSWPGFVWKVPRLSSAGAGRYGVIAETLPASIGLPCPPNPLPVAWLAPTGGYAFWVFQGKPQVGDEVGEGQRYTEAGTDEQRHSQRGVTRRTVTTSSGLFQGADLLEGLRTLWASPQAWYRPQPTGPWVPILVASGTFPAGRLGVRKQQVSLSFTEARPRYAQGQ